MSVVTHHGLMGDRLRRLTGADLLDRVDLEQLVVARQLAADPKRRASLGQYMTPPTVAAFMASMLEFDPPPQELRLLDAGSGVGMLTAAVVAEFATRPAHRRPVVINAEAWEIDGYLEPSLIRTFAYCEKAALNYGMELKWNIRMGDFISQAADMIATNALFGHGTNQPFNVAILNPPYRKLNADSAERAHLDALGIGTSNLYSAFVWLALELLQAGGEIVAITPRSFMNGTYFRKFREALLQQTAIRRVHVYDARDVAFSDDGVLQENVVFHAVRGVDQGPIRISTSYGPSDTDLTERVVDPSDMVLTGDTQSVMRVVPDENAARITRGMIGLSHRMVDLEIGVSTGQVVGFRARDRIHAESQPGDIPLILPRHCRSGFVQWPQKSRGVPNSLSASGADDELVMPSGWYVLVKRFSSKEERRRVVASLFDPNRLNADHVAFDNKLNVVHRGNAGLPESLAKGLAVFLNSSVVDSFFRQFSGHTQVNAGDLRSLKFPDADALARLGNSVSDLMPSADEIDNLVSREVPGMSDSIQATAATRRIEEALGILKAIGVPRGQENERSALTLLALLNLAPEDAWDKSEDPLRGVNEIMDWMQANYGRSYAPNTRETIRRFTLHQFIAMGLVSRNPDDPSRAVNSPHNVYQVHPSLLNLVCAYGSGSWEEQLGSFQDELEERNRLNETERSMEMIPVTLPDGTELSLTPGGQNDLVKEIIEGFAPRFVPGGHVIYVGDAGASGRHFDAEYLAGLGVLLDEAGQMPDVVIHSVDRDWLVIVEAVTSHGPVNTLRRAQLNDLFADCGCGIVYVTAFLDRTAMRQYLPEIAWETEVWVADAPTHLIHFDGEKFLGPYEDPAS